MDNQPSQSDTKDREENGQKKVERPFDPWEQAFNRDFQKRDREFEF